MLTNDEKIQVVKDYFARLKHGQPEKYCIHNDASYVSFYDSFLLRIMNKCMKNIKLVDISNNGVENIDDAHKAQFKIRAAHSAVGRELIFNWRLK